MEFDPAFVWQLSSVPNLGWPFSVIAQTNIPAESPAVNDCYLVGTRPTDVWNDKENQIAIWSSDGEWKFQSPTAGRQLWVARSKAQLQYDGRKWLPLSFDSAHELPVGGAIGYVLTKTTADDYDVEWTPPTIGGGGGEAGRNEVILFENSEVITGIEPDGTVGLLLGQGFGAYRERGDVWQFLTDHWIFRGSLSQTGIPEGGTTGQVLAKTSETDFAAAWVDPTTVGGDITSVTAGTGLTGGGTTGDVSLAVAYGTTAGTAAQGNDTRLSSDRIALGLRTATSVVNVETATAPVAGQALIANGAAGATWQDIPVSGDAGGDLSGSYPDPTVIALTTGSGRLVLGTVNDGEFLQRSGTNIVSTAGASAPLPVQVNGTLVGTRTALDIVSGSNVTVTGTDDSANNRVVVTIDTSGGGGGGGEMYSPWIPAVGSDAAWNDEFDSGSADLATRGWTVENWSTGATMTRVGEVTWHAGASLTSTQYRSTRVGSQIWIQTPTGVSLFFYKTFSSASYLFGMRATIPYYQTGMELKMWAYNSTRVATTPEKRAYGTGIFTTGTGTGLAQFIYTNSSNSQLWNPSTNTFTQDNAVQDVYTCDLRTSGAVAQMTWEASTLMQRWRIFNSTSDPVATVAAGIQVTSAGVTALSSNVASRVVVIDWIRRDNASPL